MSKLVIVESPAKAKTIKKYLGDSYEVMASNGHVRDLPKRVLGISIKSDLICGKEESAQHTHTAQCYAYSFTPRQEVVKGREKIVRELKNKAKSSEDVLLATDPDREGEAISWHLSELLGLAPEKANRVIFNEITKSGVTNGLKNPRAINMDLVNSQQARRMLDRLMGYLISPFISQKIRGGRNLSAGRVQSVAVKLIVDREAEIEAFIPQEYWSIIAKLSADKSDIFEASLASDESGKVKIDNKEQSDAYLARLQDADYSIKSVKKGTRKRSPAPPFITSTLQQEASRRFGFSADRTMRAAQQLYEGVDISGIGTTGLITYMRTDSLRVSEESRNEGNQYIKDNFGDKYLPEKPRYFRSRAGAQDGHEAIRPTSPSLAPPQVKGDLTSDQFKLYDLIWKRFIASLMAESLQATSRVEILAAKPKDLEEGKFCIFSASGYSVVFDGFTKLYEEQGDKKKEKDNKLPSLEENAKLKKHKLEANQHFTQPPARFTEASLIKALEENGIGRPSTYAATLRTIVDRGYVLKERRTFSPTELGRVVTLKIFKDHFPKIVNVKFTASMENALDEVEQGTVAMEDMLSDFYFDLDTTLKKAKADLKDVKYRLEGDITDEVCEKCGKRMVKMNGRFGPFLACEGYPECKNSKPLKLKTGALCPKCNANVIEKRVRNRPSSVFYGCERWPECDFATWNAPTGELCPKCGKALFGDKRGNISCGNEACDYKTKVSRKKKADEADKE
ncbi:MAG: type I DNA topoisomerase [Clostridiales bacterium]|nr:type I DNA topoisomerase [Clostridiales bacterium]